MTKIYVNKKEVQTKNNIDYLGFIIEAFIGTISLMLASLLFKSLFIENIFYAFIASLVISILNVSVKPLLVYLTLPVTIVTLGLFYPAIDVIILKITDKLLGNCFIINGIFIPFFIVIFINLLTSFINKRFKAYFDRR